MPNQCFWYAYQFYPTRAKNFLSCKSALNDSSSEGWSSSDEDLDFLFLEAAFPEPRLLGPRLNMEDISEINCEQMFR